MSDSKCSSPLIPMADWIKSNGNGGGEGEDCKPCMLAPIVSWYKDVLDENGKTNLSNELVESANDKSGNSITICKKLDDIKSQVDESLRERLMGFDCAAQTYER